MSIPEAFAEIALGVSQAFGTGFHEAVAKGPGTPVMEGGSIVSPGVPVERGCHCQIDSVTEAMRQAEGYKDKDVRLLVLVSTLDGTLDTSAKIAVSAGPYANTTWMLASCELDPIGSHYVCRGRKA